MSPSTPASTSTSATRTRPGSAARMKHEWAAAAVLSEGHRPQRAQRRRPRLGRPRTQRPTSQTTSVQQADRTHRRPAVAMTARIRRSPYGQTALARRRPNDMPRRALITRCGALKSAIADKHTEGATRCTTPARRELHQVADSARQAVTSGLDVVNHPARSAALAAG